MGQGPPLLDHRCLQPDPARGDHGDAAAAEAEAAAARLPLRGAVHQHHPRPGDRLLAAGVGLGQHRQEHAQPGRRPGARRDPPARWRSSWRAAATRACGSAAGARRRESRRRSRAGEPSSARARPATHSSSGRCSTLPGGSYLAGLDAIAKQDLSTVETVLTVLAFNLIMLTLLELPLIGYALAPDWTPRAVDRLKAWIASRGRRIRDLRLRRGRGRARHPWADRAAQLSGLRPAAG